MFQPSSKKMKGKKVGIFTLGSAVNSLNDLGQPRGPNVISTTFEINQPFAEKVNCCVPNTYYAKYLLLTISA